MIYSFPGTTILPARWNDFDIGGLEASVILIDTDYHFSMLQLVNLLEHRITAKLSLTDRMKIIESDSKQIEEPVDVEQLIKTSLRRLFVAHCNSTTQLVATLYSLESHLVSSAGKVSAVMIDSISAFYWIDRCSAPDVTKTVDSVHSKIVGALRKLVATYGIVVIVTKPAILHKRQKAPPAQLSGVSSGVVANAQEHFEYMGKSWQRFVTQRLVLSRKRPTFGSGQLFCARNSMKNLSFDFSIGDVGIQFTDRI